MNAVAEGVAKDGKPLADSHAVRLALAPRIWVPNVVRVVQAVVKPDVLAVGMLDVSMLKQAIREQDVVTFRDVQETIVRGVLKPFKAVVRSQQVVSMAVQAQVLHKPGGLPAVTDVQMRQDAVVVLQRWDVRRLGVVDVTVVMPGDVQRRAVLAVAYVPVPWSLFETSFSEDE